MAEEFKDSYQQVNKEAFENIIDILINGSAEAANTFADIFADRREAIEAKLAKQKRDAEKKLGDEILTLQAQGLIRNEQDRLQYVRNLEAKAANEARATERDFQLKLIKDKLDAEKQFYEQTSAATKRDQDFQIHVQEREIEILKKRAEADKLAEEGKAKEAKEKAKQAKEMEKALQREQKDEKTRKEAENYQFGESLQTTQAIESLKDAMADSTHAQKTMEQNLKKTMQGVSKAIQDASNQINSAISSYAKLQTSINARLQEVSSFSKATQTLSKVAFSPLLRAEDLYSNLQALVSQGVVSNVEQRAFFATIKDGIAETFDVTHASMLRMIRLQRNDSTAARLGLEAYLNKFLNVYVENTEYLTNTFDSVADSLFEASALLGASNGTAASLEFEYIVQKWLGTLTGLGLSDSAAQNIASAIGQLGSGEVDNNMQNLLVMAAARANMSYADMLHEGLNARETNRLLKSIVEYLQELAGYDSNVVKSQLSKIFGVTVSDLVAVTNLSKSAIAQIESDALSYDQMYGELINQFKDLPNRVGLANILENVFSNFTYQTGMNIASVAPLYAAWKITDMINGVTGGINIPYVSVMGSGFDLNATVENLIKLGIVGISTLAGIPSIITGVASAFDGSVLLSSLGINQSGAQLKQLGGGLGRSAGGGRSSGASSSESTYVGNTDAEAYKQSALSQAEEEPKTQMEEKQKDYLDPVVEYYDLNLHLTDRLDRFQTTFSLIGHEVEYISDVSQKIQKGLLGTSTDRSESTLFTNIDEIDKIKYYLEVDSQKETEYKTTVTELAKNLSSDLNALASNKSVGAKSSGGIISRLLGLNNISSSTSSEDIYTGIAREQLEGSSDIRSILFGVYKSITDTNDSLFSRIGDYAAYTVIGGIESLINAVGWGGSEPTLMRRLDALDQISQTTQSMLVDLDNIESAIYGGQAGEQISEARAQDIAKSGTPEGSAGSILSLASLASLTGIMSAFKQKGGSEGDLALDVNVTNESIDTKNINDSWDSNISEISTIKTTATDINTALTSTEGTSIKGYLSTIAGKEFSPVIQNSVTAQAGDTNVDMGSVVTAVNNLRKQQLAIYQSQMMGILYDGEMNSVSTGSASTFKKYYQTLQNKDGKQIRANGYMNGNAIQITDTSNKNFTTSITPLDGGQYASLSDYLIQIQFAEKLTSITNDVKEIMKKVVGKVKTDSYDDFAVAGEITGFTNIRF